MPACCEMMARQLQWKCDLHNRIWDCPDALVAKLKRSYGLIVHDGGESSIEIAYCPWCGTPLK
ncbi:DUF6980 family protein [Granulicella rosea]|uniref:DUF6980 family protein n=1 Tax=Granulicella rosea TaxID=474952 RepID=UPI000B79086F